MKTIYGVKADTALKSLASTILSKFLSNRDNNFKYMALNILRDVVKVDAISVQKHKNTILACLKDQDISIRRRALDLVYVIINTSNIKSVVKEIFDYLMTTEEENMKLELTFKLSQSISKYSPSTKWLIDTYIKMLCLSDSYVSEDTISLIINDILKCPSFKVYSVHKCFLAIKNNPNAEALAKVCIFIIGEYGEDLIGQKIIPGEDPDDLVIAEGGAATTAYARLQFESLNKDIRLKINEALLRYCELDTFAMVMIVQGWKNFLQIEN